LATARLLARKPSSRLSWADASRQVPAPWRPSADAKHERRSRKLSEAIRRAVQEAVLHSSSSATADRSSVLRGVDGRRAGLAVTDVRLAPGVATVLWDADSALSAQQLRSVGHWLDTSAGRLRRQVAKAVRLRTVPRLRCGLARVIPGAPLPSAIRAVNPAATPTLRFAPAAEQRGQQSLLEDAFQRLEDERRAP